MKTASALAIAIAVIVAIVLLITETSTPAKWISWRPFEKPPISLSEALVIAADALKKQKQDKEYYCLQANLGRRVTTADWELLFAATDGSQLWVNVGSDKSTDINKDGFFH